MSIRKTALYVLIALGLIISGYLTYAHYTNTALVCPNTGIINCAAVNSSAYSEIFGVPVALLGLILFILAILMLPKGNDLLVFLWSVGSAMGALYSIISMFIIGYICVYCTSLDAVMLLTILVANMGLRERKGGWKK